MNLRERVLSHPAVYRTFKRVVLEGAFGHGATSIVTDLLRIPYTHVILTATP